jgi:hypothetical protein
MKVATLDDVFKDRKRIMRKRWTHRRDSWVAWVGHTFRYANDAPAYIASSDIIPEILDGEWVLWAEPKEGKQS